MKTIAIGGLGYSIRPFFNESVECFDVGAFGQNNLYRQIEQSIRSYNWPVRLIGFSRGATFAVKLAFSNSYVWEVYAHSPGKFKGRYPKLIHADFRLFRTKGDRMGGVYESTGEIFNNIASSVSKNIEDATCQKDLSQIFKTAKNAFIHDLLFSQIPDPSGITQRIMNNRKHVFHNCLHYLPKEILA